MKWNLVRLTVIFLIAAALGMVFGAVAALFFVVLFVIGGSIGVYLEWREYRDDLRPPHLRGGDVWSAKWAIEVFCGWPVGLITGFLGLIFCLC